MKYSYIETQVEDHVGIIIINNPKANTLSNGVTFELLQVLQEFEKNSDIRVVIITGYGEKFFVAGAEINEFIDKNSVEAQNLSRQLQFFMNQIENFSRPVIAAINGFCIGGGLELAMSCDIRYASDNAKLGLAEIKLGIIPGAGGTQRLPRIIGAGKAKEMMYTGELISAQESLSINLIQKVTEQKELMNECKKLAKKIVNNSPLIIKLLKETINKGLDAPLDSGLSIEADKFGLCFSTEDKVEGINAFLEHRIAIFKGK